VSERGPVVPGHVSVRPRVLQRVAGAVVAEQLHVDRHDVRVDATDDGGDLALHVATPVRVPALDRATLHVATPVRVPALDRAAGLPEGGVLGLVRELQGTVRSRVRELTGRSVSRVDVVVTGARAETRRRVS